MYTCPNTYRWEKVFFLQSDGLQKVYNYMSRKQNRVSSEIDCIKRTDGSLASADSNKADTFTEYCVTVSLTMIKDYLILTYIISTVQYAINVMGKLKRNSAPGPDNGCVQYRNVGNRFAKFPISSTRLLRNVCKLFRYQYIYTNAANIPTWFPI